MRQVIIGILVCLSVSPSVAGESNPDDLVAYWNFDDRPAPLVADCTGQGNAAIVTGGLLVKGVHQTGLQFDGQTTSVRCPHSPTLSLSHALTIEGWVKFDKLPVSGFPSVVRKGACYALRFSGGRLGLLVWVDGQVKALESARTDWAVDRWYHLAGTYDGAQMRLFVDGQEDANSPRPHTGLVDVTGTDLGIGSNGSQHLLAGVIDEVRLFGRAVSSDEIEAFFQKGRASLQAEKDVTVTPLAVGRALPEFRKPKREIVAVEDGFLWIDAEDFTDYGGWTLDTQFVHLMGSGYLIAAATGTPVDDATVSVDIPEPGTYRLWVRAKDWLPEHSPGQFQVLVDGQASKQVFGQAETDAWDWQSAGEFRLDAKTVRLALRDMTGYYGRCDALLLTADLNYTPPNDVEALQRERSRLTGLSLESRVVDDFDVVVVGAGAAGCCAAIASARMGARTALIQNRPVLGGNASVEMGVPISGASCCHPNARESGIIEEAGGIKARYGYPKMSEAFRIMAEGEPNLSLFMNTHVYDVRMQDARSIAAVQAIDTLTGERTVYRGKLFLDCTGDGWVGYFAKADFRMGREARGEFNESLAPETTDNITMSGCLMGRRALSYRAESMGRSVGYTPPPWAAKLPPADQFGRTPRGFTGGEWWLEHPGIIDDLWDAEKARDELIRISYGYWDYIKNAWPERRRAAKYALTYVPITDAKRESRRLLGDYILNQNDVQNPIPFPDRISYGGWPLDIHHPEGIFSGEEGPFDFNPRVPIYTIPFRCLYSRNVDNLLFAGRDASVTHVALGTVRVQGTLAPLGQAAGTAAALCLKQETTPRGLYEEHMTLLQQTLLKHDQYIPGTVNEDPADVARRATVTASSTAEYDAFERSEVVPAKDAHPLNMPRAVLFPRGLKDRLSSISLLLLSQLAEPTPLTIHVRGAAAAGDFSSTEDVATATAVVPPGRESFVKFDVDCRIDTPFVWIWADKAEGISWRLMSRAPVTSCRAYGGGDRRSWQVVPGQYYAVAVSPPLAIPADYRPENVINGKTRLIGREPNMWASDPEQTMPQWIQLDFATPSSINTASVTFDTDMNDRWHTTPLVPQSVRDYELAYDDGGRWIPLATERGNFQRHRIHRFPAVTTSRLRLTVHQTNGDPSARVFEIRAYHE